MLICSNRENVVSEINAIILAAGGSVRMGTGKMLLPFRGMTIIEKVIENVLEAGIDRIIVVTGSDKEAITKLIRRLPVEQCFNEKWNEGMLSSVKCGFRALPETCRAAIVFLGDQPMIDPKTIEEVAYAFRKTGKGIIMPVYKKKRGHPLLLDTKYYLELERLHPDEGLRALAQKFPVDVLEVETDDPAVLRDIDTPEDYRNELK